MEDTSGRPGSEARGGADELIAACHELREDGLHHLSLNSKELFHSNLLAWFAERYPAAAADAFDGLACPGEPGPGEVVERETNHLDLVLRLPGLAPVVIENKVWSLPDDSQLDKYASNAAIDNDRWTCVLLSLTAPSWEGGRRTFQGCTWVHLSYAELADRLQPVVEQLPAADPFDVELLRRYVAMVRRLCRLAAVAGQISAADPVYLAEEVVGELRKARIFDGVSKLRAETMARLIHQRLSDLEPRLVEATPAEAGAARLWRRGWTVFRLGNRTGGLETTFTNGTPLLSGAAVLANRDTLFWQLQGNQWRLAVQTGSQQYSGRDDNTREKRHNYIKTHYGPWFDFRLAAETLRLDTDQPEPVRGGGEFQRYDPDFAYRYVRIDRAPAPLTVSRLVEMGSHYLQNALAWIG